MTTQSEPTPVAAIDLGSNSFHLLIGRFLRGHFQILNREKVRVQLAQGLDEHDILSEEAIIRGLDTLRQLGELLVDIPKEEIRVVATYTLRKAKNRQEFLRQATAVLPYPIEVISGAEEARLIYQGVAHTQPGKEQRLVIDIGGGSTECIIGQGFSPIILNSLGLGCVTFGKRYFNTGEITSERFKKAELAACKLVAPIANSYKKAGWKTVFGCSGTIKAIAYCISVINPESADVTAKNLTLLKERLCADGKVDSSLFSELEPERANVLASGLAVLIGLFKELNIETMQLSDAALREGLIFEMEDHMLHDNIRERTAVSLVERYHVDQAQAQRVQATAIELYQAVKDQWKISGKKLKPLLNWAALLHEIGTSIDYKGFHRHGAYILENTSMPGFNSEEQQLLATLVVKHRKKLSSKLPSFTLFDDSEVLKLVLLLRLATLLHIHRSDDIPSPQISAESADSLTLKFERAWLNDHILLEERLEQERKAWAKVGKTLVIDSIIPSS